MPSEIQTLRARIKDCRKTVGQLADIFLIHIQNEDWDAAAHAAHSLESLLCGLRSDANRLADVE